MSTRRAWAARGALLGAGLMVGLALAECGARSLRPGDAADLLFNGADNAPADLYTLDRRLLHRPTEGFRGVQQGPGFKVELRINSLGCRGPEPGPKGAPRWMAAGDSFTFAAQVAEEDTFAARLARATGQEVVNAAADGYSTWQALYRYEDLEPRLDLDGVLLTYFVGNDLDDDFSFAERTRWAASRPEGVRMPAALRNPVEAFLSRHSVLFDYWRMHRRAVLLEREDSPERRRWQAELSLFTAAGHEDLERNAAASEVPLRGLRDATRAWHDRLLVAVAPPAFQVLPERAQATFALLGMTEEPAGLEAPAQRVTALLGSLGIPTCDLVAPLRAAAVAGREVYLPWDAHWSVEGHAVVAEAMRACMAREGWLGESASTAQ